jgi:NADPH-dependent ferric siderophore reductase
MQAETVRRTLRVRHEPRRRAVQVRAVEPLSPGFVSITFAGDDLADFQSHSFDDHVKFVFTGAAGEELKRDYTPRRFDAARRELVIEFVLHGHGEASEWARRAASGAEAIIAGPKSSMIVPVDFAWHLLAGDETALPAIQRRLEELPAGARALVLVKVDDPADRRSLASPADLTVEWLSPDQALADRIATIALPEGEGFAWAAGEAASMARVREVLLKDRCHPLEAMRVSSYWNAAERP